MAGAAPLTIAVEPASRTRRSRSAAAAVAPAGGRGGALARGDGESAIRGRGPGRGGAAGLASGCARGAGVAGVTARDGARRVGRDSADTARGCARRDGWAAVDDASSAARTRGAGSVVAVGTSEVWAAQGAWPDQESHKAAMRIFGQLDRPILRPLSPSGGAPRNGMAVVPANPVLRIHRLIAVGRFMREGNCRLGFRGRGPARDLGVWGIAPTLRGQASICQIWVSGRPYRGPRPPSAPGP